MFSCLTEIFLSTAWAERCKINFGKFWVGVVWLPESRLGRERGTGHLALLVLLRTRAWASLGQRGSGSATWTVFQPRGERGVVHGAEQFGAGLPVNRGPPPLSCPWWLILQRSPFQGPMRECGQEINNKPNQRSNTAYQENHETAFMTSRLSYLWCPDISLQCKRADWGIGKPRCARYLGLAGWQVDLRDPCFLAVGYRWHLGLIFTTFRSRNIF